MKAAVLRFPGSNCDDDTRHALEACGFSARLVPHTETDLNVDLVVLPGGFSYGDYLRSGALAARSPIMAAVQRFAARGGLVLGICNGFQVLTEAGLLPGQLARNAGLTFLCTSVTLRLERPDTPFTRAYRTTTLRLPIAHGEGSYYADEETLERLEREGQVVFRYVDEDGEVRPEANPNGSAGGIAGIINARGNVLGMMPHPERAVEPLLGGADGRPLFESLLTQAVAG